MTAGFAPSRMNDNDMKYLSDLVTIQVSGNPNSNYALTHKLLYLILEEAAATRRRTEYTNKLLEEIADSIKKSTKAVKRLARATISFREDDLYEDNHQD